MEQINCLHPLEKRWQYNGFWMCCKCNRTFWGKKEDNPKADIYGAPFLTHKKKPKVYDYMDNI